MKVLVLSEDYPSQNKVSSMYVHTRNVYYKENGIEVDVINFSASKSYIYEGLRVMTLQDYVDAKNEYDLLILHAANIRHHFKFLKKYGQNFKKYLFFFHGHEVLKVNKVYPKPYSYVKKDPKKGIKRALYDIFKLNYWKHQFPKIVGKSYLIFVSNWMREEFLKWTEIPESIIEGREYITYNCVSKEFENETYDENVVKEYEFVTIRSFLDGSKYAMDIVNRLAENTPESKFLVVGKGDFYAHYKKPDNLEWKNQTMTHNEIVETLQKSRFALMPTRTDAQGLMMCEMAAFGIPVITSDIPVCHEVFDGFENTYYISNEDEIDLKRFDNVESKCMKDDRYYMKNTISKELNVIKTIISDRD